MNNRLLLMRTYKLFYYDFAFCPCRLIDIIKNCIVRVLNQGLTIWIITESLLVIFYSILMKKVKYEGQLSLKHCIKTNRRSCWMSCCKGQVFWNKMSFKFVFEYIWKGGFIIDLNCYHLYLQINEFLLDKNKAVYLHKDNPFNSSIVCIIKEII